VTERVDDQQHDEERPKAVPALVEEQVELARAGVFRAYVRAREKARRLAQDGAGEHHDERRHAS
jgi:hypothetical protein